MSLSAIVALVAGAGLALAGGIVERHLEFRRSLRVAARAVYDELLSNLVACHFDVHRLQVAPAVLTEDDSFDVTSDAWNEYAPVFAAMRRAAAHDALRGVYQALTAIDGQPSSAVLHAEMQAGFLNSAYGIGSASGASTFYETREENIAHAIAQLTWFLPKLARFAGINSGRVASDIAGARPGENPDVPGYFMEVTDRPVHDVESGTAVESVARSVHRRDSAPMSKRSSRDGRRGE